MPIASLDPLPPQGQPGLRIASLVPSLTELVVELGLGDCLVARTGFCIHPAAALRDVPKIGGTKDVNLSRLRQLAPTHVLVNVDENRHASVEAMRTWPQPPQIVVTHPNSPDDNLALVVQLLGHFGAHPGVAARAATLLDALRHELGLTLPGTRSVQNVLYLIWHAPWMTVARDTYLSRMLGRIDWCTLPDARGGSSGAARYPVVHGSEPWLADVQRVLLSSEPFRFEAKHIDAAQRLCPNAVVQPVDGELLSWYGARAVPGLRYLRALAQPAG